MFDLDSAWWEMPLRAFIIYAVLLALVRFSGRRSIGQFTPFDLLMVMLLSEAVSNSLSSPDVSVFSGLLSAASLIAVNTVMAAITARSDKAHSLMEGGPIMIGRDGELFEHVLLRHRVPLADVAIALREADTDLAEVKLAFLEADGKISLLRNSREADTPLRTKPSQAVPMASLLTPRCQQAPSIMRAPIPHKEHNMNAINWFEIPCSDFERAIRFYESIFKTELKREQCGETATMAIFPHAEHSGVGGALVSMPEVTPHRDGVRVYLNGGENLGPILDRVSAAGGQVIMPKTFLREDIGHIGMFADSEGNVVGLHSLN